jgi:hypothetical protein
VTKEIAKIQLMSIVPDPFYTSGMYIITQKPAQIDIVNTVVSDRETSGYKIINLDK